MKFHERTLREHLRIYKETRFKTLNSRVLDLLKYIHGLDGYLVNGVKRIYFNMVNSNGPSGARLCFFCEVC